MAITVGPEYEDLITELVASGRYSSASEVVQEALRLLRERDAEYQGRLQVLRADIAVGLEQADRGELAPLDAEAIKAEGRKRLAAERNGRTSC